MKKLIVSLILMFAIPVYATVSATSTKRQFFTATGGTTYTFTMPVNSEDDIRVQKRVTTTGVTTVLTQDVDYTIASTGGDYLNGGVVTIAPALATTFEVIVIREIEQTQETDSGAVNAASIELMVDKNMRAIQDLRNDFEQRAIKLPESDALSLNSTLTNSVDGAGLNIGRDASGNITESAEATTTVSFSAFGETLVDGANASATLSTLGFSTFGKTFIDDADADATMNTLSGIPVFNVKTYGAQGDGTDDIVFIQLAADAAEAAKGILYFPQPTTQYVITDSIVINTADVKVLGSGMNCVIRQTTWGKPCFEIRADDIWIDGIYILCTESRVNITNATFDNLADGLQAYCAGVYIVNADRYRLTNLKISGFVSGIRPRGVTNNSTLNEGGIIESIWIDTVDWGIIPRQQKGMLINDVQISDYALSQTANPSHAIYMIGQTGVVNTDCIISNVTAWDGTDGHAFQVKYSDNCTFSNLTANNTPGLLIFATAEVSDCTFTNINGFTQTDTGGTNAKIHIAGVATMVRNRISGVSVDNSTPGNVALSILDDSVDNIIEDVLITDSAASDATEQLVLRGTRNIMRNIRVNNTDIARLGIVIGAGTDCILDNYQVVNGSGANFFTIAASATNATIFYDADKIATTASLTISDSGTNSLIHDVSKRLVVTTVNLTASEIKALASAPIEMVAAPGGGLYLEFISAVLLLDKGAIAYDDAAADGNMVIRYTDGSGVVVSASIEADDFIDAAFDTITNAIPVKDAIVAASASVNEALVLDNDGAEYTTGNGVIRIKITTRTQRSLGL